MRAGVRDDSVFTEEVIGSLGSERSQVKVKSCVAQHAHLSAWFSGLPAVMSPSMHFRQILCEVAQSITGDDKAATSIQWEGAAVISDREQLGLN